MISRIFCILIAVTAGSVVGAHPATERYIPFGYWTEVGAENVMLGTVRSQDGTGTMVIEVGGRVVRVSFDKNTKVWIDPGQGGGANRAAGYADLRSGQQVEVRLNYGQPTARWVKIR